MAISSSFSGGENALNLDCGQWLQSPEYTFKKSFNCTLKSINYMMCEFSLNKTV